MQKHVKYYFNSIKVQLRHNLKARYTTFQTHFNSIKVQLRLYSIFGNSFLIFLFQFHKGTIKTIAVLSKFRVFKISIP